MGPLPPGALVGRLGDSLIPKGDPMEARLQEMLRYNMDKYANSNLDTLHISRKVRELLSVHNIGQRLFAKYVLGLSQGTVSELLSKPKPWDKLTEKGRDSYRKMHAWAWDEAAVLLLKSLIPKKGIYFIYFQKTVYKLVIESRHCLACSTTVVICNVSKRFHQFLPFLCNLPSRLALLPVISACQTASAYT